MAETIHSYDLVVNAKNALAQVRKIQKLQKQINQQNKSSTQQSLRNERSVQQAQQQTNAQKNGHLRRQRTAEQRAALQKQKALAKEKADLKRFHQFRDRQLSTMQFARLDAEKQYNLKRILWAEKSHQEVMENYKTELNAIKRNANAQKVREAKRKKVAAQKGGALGAMPLMANPLGMGIAAATGGVMVLGAGSSEYKELQQGANTVGMDVNSFNKLASSIAASSDVSRQGSVDLIQDLLDRAGETIEETTYDSKTGEFVTGEGSILANYLKEQGIIQGNTQDELEASMKQFFSQTPDMLFKAISEASRDMTTQQRAFILEAFTSNLNRAAAGYTENRAAFDQGGRDALTFNVADTEAIKAFSEGMRSFGAMVQQIPLGLFKEFTNSLSPSSLKLLENLGTLIGNLVGLLGDGFAAVLNLVSPMLNEVVTVFSALTEKLKPITEQFTKITDVIGQMFGEILGGIKKLLSALNPFSGDEETTTSATNGTTSTSSTPAPVSSKPVPVPRASYIPKASNTYSGYGTQRPIQVQVQAQLDIDSETVATSVMNTQTAEGAIERTLNNHSKGNF